MSWRDDHALLVFFARARDRNHSRSSGGGVSCEARNAQRRHVHAKNSRPSCLQDAGKGREQERSLRARQAGRKGQTVLSQETKKPLSGNVISLFFSVLMQHAG